jgi:hypothetical protein
MKTKLLFFMAFVAATGLDAQNFPVDFESSGNGATWNWTVFENDVNPALEIVANPDPTGINTSSTVAKYTALQAGNPYAGCETEHGAGTGSFLIDANNAQVRIMVWKSVISDVGVKLVRPDGWSLGEIKVSNTVTNQWEQLTFDFSAHIGLSPAYDQVVVFPDFQARTSDNVIYFDNIFGAPAGSFGLDEGKMTGSKIFPNPGNGDVRVESNQLVDLIQVANLIGEVVSVDEVKGYEHNLNLSSLPKGIYLITLVSETDREVLRYILR